MNLSVFCHDDQRVIGREMRRGGKLTLLVLWAAKHIVTRRLSVESCDNIDEQSLILAVSYFAVFLCGLCGFA